MHNVCRLFVFGYIFCIASKAYIVVDVCKSLLFVCIFVLFVYITFGNIMSEVMLHIFFIHVQSSHKRINRPPASTGSPGVVTAALQAQCLKPFK